MITLQNLHTHSKWCDGKDTVEEMILHARAIGFDSVGFSVHSPMFYAPSHAIADEKLEEYICEVRSMKEKYRDTLAVYCGVELDLFSRIDLSPFDYVIGSVHYLQIDGEYVGFDRNAASVKKVIDSYFGGDGMRYAKAYYETLATLPKRGRIDVVGHFDLITKHAENESFFDPECAEYLGYATEAIDALVGKIPLFEINTGAIARGYRTTPYPTLTLLKEIRRRGGKIIISSDCHDKPCLDKSFDDAVELARAAGYDETHVLTDGGFVPVSLCEMQRRLRER